MSMHVLIVLMMLSSESRLDFTLRFFLSLFFRWVCVNVCVLQREYLREVACMYL